MAAATTPPYFFLHVMKTGGTTFQQHIDANFAADECYPLEQSGLERVDSYFLLERLRALTAEQRRAIKLYAGHFPYVATTLLEHEPITLALVREPLARTVSLLRHRKRYVAENRDMTLEEIYDDPWVYPVLVHNYQVRLFAMTAEDAPRSYHDTIEIDDNRIAHALDNVRRLHVLGLTERFDEFIGEVADRYGWRTDPIESRRVSTENWPASDALLRRIAADNRAELEFHAEVVAEHAHRRAERSATGHRP